MTLKILLEFSESLKQDQVSHSISILGIVEPLRKSLLTSLLIQFSVEIARSFPVRSINIAKTCPCNIQRVSSVKKLKISSEIF